MNYDNLSLTDKRKLLEKALKEKASRQIDSWPLSRAQKSMWYLFKSAPDGSAHNVVLALRFLSAVNPNLLKKIFQQLINRHELLRASFTIDDGRISQKIIGYKEIDFKVEDVSKLEQTSLNNEIKNDARLPFDLSENVARVRLYQISPNNNILLFIVHHIVFDGWSLWLLLEELKQLYIAETSNQHFPLKSIKTSYLSYIQQQEKMLSSDLGSQLSRFWQTELADVPQIINLVTDRPRPSIKSFQGASCPIELDDELTSLIKQFAKHKNATPFMVLLAIFQVLLYRRTQQEQFLIGIPVLGRNHEQFTDVVGYFSNAIALRSDISENLRFTELLERVRHRVLKALEHQDYPLAALLEQLDVTRDLSYSPLLQVFFMLQKSQISENRNLLSNGLDWGGTKLERFPFAQQEGQNDLDLEFFETGDTFTGSFKYNTALFDHSTIERIAKHYENILIAVLENPTAKIKSLDILSEDEKQQLLIEWNQTKQNFPWDKSIPQLFEEQVMRTPDAIACYFEDQHITYREINTKANQLAHYLCSDGHQAEQRIGLYLERSPSFLIGLLAIFKCGATYVALDTAFPPAYLERIVQDASPSLILTNEERVQRIENFHARIFKLDSQESITLLAKFPNTNLSPCLKPDQLAQIAYTSGSTGDPKGVMITHYQLLNWLYALWNRMPFTSDEVVAQKTNAAFVVSLKEMLAGLLAGAPQVFIRDDVAKDIPAFIKVLDDFKVTRLNIVPSHLQVLLKTIDQPQQLNTLKYCITAGEPLSQALRHEVQSKLPWISLWNNYGCTELNDVTYCAPDEQDTAGAFVPVGRPIANTKVYVLDAELKPVPIGVPGELCVESIGVSRGYWNKPELTRERFLASPFSDDPTARLYRTGDIVRYLNNGVLEYIGRRDFEIKIRGYRIDVRQVEHHIKSYPGIKEIVVSKYAKSDHPDSAHLVAYYVSRGNQVKVNDLQSYLLSQVPAFMVPTLYMALDALPKLPNGKINRRDLPPPDSLSPQEDNYVAPTTSTEWGLAHIWSELLSLPEEHIGKHDNFFTLGGDSLLTTQVILSIHTKFDIELPMRRLFEAPTLAKLAKSIDEIKSNQQVVDVPRINLRNEATLDPSITISKGEWNSLDKAKNIFLTGGTGYVGGHLLMDLLLNTTARIYCLVRGNEADAIIRLDESLKRHGFYRLSEFKDRIDIVSGDLDQYYFGLSKDSFDRLANDLDVIIHSGASINLAQPYYLLKPVNVNGTQEIIRLASTKKIKTLHHLSTTVVFDADAYYDGRSISEEEEPLETEGMDQGYPVSKWVAENLVKQAQKLGIPTCVYRLGAVVGSSTTGIWKSDDLVHKAIAAAIKSHEWIEFNIDVNWVPVDYVSNAILALARDASCNGKTFHLVSRSRVKSDDVYFALLENKLVNKKISLDEWTEQSDSTAIDFPRLLTSHQLKVRDARGMNAPKFDIHQTAEKLAKLGIEIPCIDKDIIAKMVAKPGNFHRE